MSNLTNCLWERNERIKKSEVTLIESYLTCTILADIPQVDTVDVGDRLLLTGLFCLQSYKHLFYLHLISN